MPRRPPTPHRPASARRTFALGRADVRHGHPQRHPGLVLRRRPARRRRDDDPVAAAVARRGDGRRRAPTCSTSAASRRGPATRRCDAAEELARVVPGHRGRPRGAAGHADQRRHDQAGGGRGGARRRRRPASTTSGDGRRRRRWPARRRARRPARPDAQPGRAALRRPRRRGRRRPAGAPSSGPSRPASPGSDLIVDPGIGFGKTAEHNLALLRDLGALRVLGRPILLGTSRKSTLGKVLDLPRRRAARGDAGDDRAGIAAGVDIVRVHDVRANVRAARVADAIVRGDRRADRRRAADERPDRPREHGVRGPPRRLRLGARGAAAVRGRRRARPRPAAGRRDDDLAQTVDYGPVYATGPADRRASARSSLIEALAEAIAQELLAAFRRSTRSSSASASRPSSWAARSTTPPSRSGRRR